MGQLVGTCTRHRLWAVAEHTYDLGIAA